jgi:acetoin utilization deacetylase AcuC-like enzyme
MSPTGGILTGMTPTLAEIPVFYSEHMVARIESYSPSAGKPQAAVDSWRQIGVPLRLVAPPPVTRRDFKRAHDPLHVDAILDLTKNNGFDNRSPAVAAALPHTSGAMLAAAREALRNGAVACAPCSGFHHAGLDYCGGFCTFNGLMVAALALREEGLVSRVGILDFDQHHGDGTADIIRRRGLDWVIHYSAGKHFHRPDKALCFLSHIGGIVARMAGAELILYQAGADAHVDDPLGGRLTTAQLLQRDTAVFAAARALGIPVAWNLAGGYQRPLRRVLDIHDNTMRACWQCHGGRPDSAPGTRPTANDMSFCGV